MTESIYVCPPNIRNQTLKDTYKKYTDHIISFEKHIEKIYNDWVIDINSRNYVLQKLDSMIKLMIKIYNKNMIKIYRDASPSEMKDIIEDKTQQIITTNFDMLNMLQDDQNQIPNPFLEIKEQLVDLTKENGSGSMDDFLRLCIGDQYAYFLNKADVELFNLYNKIFVPLSINISVPKTKNLNSDPMTITKTESKCDSLINNTCSIAIGIASKKIVFEGYVCPDILNAYVRASQIYSKYIFQNRTKIKDLVKEHHPEMDEAFYIKYTKFINGSDFFINSPKEFVQKMVADYNLFNDCCSKNLNSVMKEFVNTNIKTMYTMINLLLMGNEQNISTGTILFDLLKDKKVSGETLGDIIYHNLSYHLQIKLKKSSGNLKSELARIKTLNTDNISIEKRLASMVNMPDSVKAYILEKVNEIKTGENNYKLQMSINGLMQFPWKPKDSKNDFSDIRKSMSKSRDYLQNVAKNLDLTVYGHENGKKMLIELMGKWIQNPESTGQVIGLVGPPGTGKTLLAKSISNALGIPLSIVGLGGMSDSADLIGHSFTYAGAQYGMIVRQMIKAGNWRCVMFFDEVDKVSKRNDTNEIYNTLIHITDPNMNQHFQDRFYSSSIEFDLSGVLIVFSYNSSEKLDPILLDRIKEINIMAYTTLEKISIVQNYVLAELCTNIGFNRHIIHIEDATIRYLIEKYTLEAGVRELRRKLEQILLKLNIDRFYMRGPFKKIMHEEYLAIGGKNELEDMSEKKTDLKSYVEYKKHKLEEMLDEATLNKIFNLEFEHKIIIGEDLLHKYLDKPTMLAETIHQSDMVGVMNGLYATSLGVGGIVPIQIFKKYVGSRDSSNLKLKLTGNLKNVMRESVICAFTTAINILNIRTRHSIMDNFPYGFHIHTPDGGTPKDGPSAGCAFTTAFVSVLLNKKIKKTVAMTGEIELTGKVSKIGGLNAKLFGAKKAGISLVFICEENREDYMTIKNKNPELFDASFEIVIIEHILDIVTDPRVIIGIEDGDFDPKMLEDYNRKNIK